MASIALPSTTLSQAPCTTRMTLNALTSASRDVTTWPWNGAMWSVAAKVPNLSTPPLKVLATWLTAMMSAATHIAGIHGDGRMRALDHTHAKQTQTSVHASLKALGEFLPWQPKRQGAQHMVLIANPSTTLSLAPNTTRVTLIALTSASRVAIT